MTGRLGIETPPLHFVVPVWGERYVDLFLNVTLPTFLSPRNIPCLPGLHRCAFHIVTMSEDMEAIRSSAVFRILSGYLPTHIHLFESFDENKYNQMSWGHLRGMALANEVGAATVFLNADMVFSDGSFESIARILASGKRVIEIEGVRTIKPGMVEGLRKRFFNPATQAITVPANDLVRLMLDNLHKMSLSHFWEPEDDQGFMPFHTYFRVGRHGLIARSTHLFPFVVYPRNLVPIDKITTIDWDLVDKACPDPEDSYVVTDSREIVAAEMSDPDYYVKPWYVRRDVEQYYRDFYRNPHRCSERHRQVLKYVISFYTGRTTGLDWSHVRRRVDAWYEDVLQAAVDTVPERFSLKQVTQLKVAALVAPYWRTLNEPAIERLIAALFRKYFRRSYALYANAGATFSKSYNRLLALAPRYLMRDGSRSAWLADLDRLYLEECRKVTLPAADSVNLLLGTNFFGLNWGDDDLLYGQTCRYLGPDDTGTIFLRLVPADYEVELYIYSAPEGGVYSITATANGEVLLDSRVVFEVDRFLLRGLITKRAVESGNGLVTLVVSAGMSAGSSVTSSALPKQSEYCFTRLAVNQRPGAAAQLLLPNAGRQSLCPKREFTGLPKRRRVRMLVALWGVRYIKLFCESCLPTLLASNNVPLLARNHDFDLVFLTSMTDADHFDLMPEIAALRAIVPVHLLSIDDILTKWWNPSTSAYGIVLTYAFHKGIMSMGDAQLNTHFIFWNADFCISDGSFGYLSDLLAYENFSGILAPSLRVDENAVVPKILATRPDGQLSVSMGSREMSQLALQHLHPTVLGKTIDNSTGHTCKIANQFYWKIDDELMVSRNFLLFMLCIKPEKICYEIAAYCDYGFIPEYVPSGSIHTVQHSDDILLLELQNPDKEAEHVTQRMPGTRFDPRDYQAYISEWSTEEHRANSRVLTFFQSGNRTYDLNAIQTLTNAFMEPLYAGLHPEPRWHNGHPYWLGTILALGKSAKTTLPCSRHSVTLRSLGIDFDMYVRPVVYFGESWRFITSAFRVTSPLDLEHLTLQLERLEEEYRSRWRVTSLPHLPGLDLDLSDDFFGTGWSACDGADGEEGRRIGPSGQASILLCLQPGRMLYNADLQVRGPEAQLNKLRVLLNGVAYGNEIEIKGNTGRLKFQLPRGVVDSTGGRIELCVQVGQRGPLLGAPTPVVALRLTVRSYVSANECWPIVLPTMDRGDFALVRRQFEEFGDDVKKTTVGRLLKTRHDVLVEGRSWSWDDLSAALCLPIESEAVEGVKQIVRSVLLHERDPDVAIFIQERLATATSADGEAWMALYHLARETGKQRVAFRALSRALALAEDRYLDTYPDVAVAFLLGNVPSAADHYLRFGRSEGRRWPSFIPTDDVAALLYLQKYPDVAEGVFSGAVSDPKEHFNRWGRSEGREWLGAA